MEPLVLPWKIAYACNQSRSVKRRERERERERVELLTVTVSTVVLLDGAAEL